LSSQSNQLGGSREMEVGTVTVAAEDKQQQQPGAEDQGKDGAPKGPTPGGTPESKAKGCQAGSRAEAGPQSERG